MTEPNYNGRQPNNSAYIKTFVIGNSSSNYWQQFTFQNSNYNYLQPSDLANNLVINKDLFVGGKIYNHYDHLIKYNLTNIPLKTSEDILKLNCVQYKLDNNNSDNVNESLIFGLDANQVETFFPNLVNVTPNNINYKSIDYIKIIPLLIQQIQQLKLENDEIKIQMNEMKDLVQEKW